MTTPTELEQAVRGTAEALGALLRHEDLLGPDAEALESLVEELRGRVDREGLVVAVIGEQKAGKSTLLNAILGEPVLGVAVRECTGTVTRIRRGPPGYRVVTTEGERMGSDLDRVARLTDQRSAEVLELDLWMPSAVLPDGLVLLDTPGVNTAEARNQERAWRAIEEEADGCLLVTDLQQAMSRSTREFLQRVREHVPEVYLMLTKIDRVWENAEAVDDDPEEEIEAARQVGVRRFARETGARPEEVVAWAVAAKPVLEGTHPEFERRFRRDLQDLVQRLTRDRQRILVSRAAQAARRGVELVDRSSEAAHGRSAERLARLEAQRIPDPEAFREAALAALDLAGPVDEAVTAMRDSWLDGLGDWHRRWDDGIAKSTNRRKLKQLVAAIEEDMATALEIHAGRALNAGQAALEARYDALAAGVMEELTERYRLVDEVRAGALGVVDLQLRGIEAEVGLERLDDDAGPRRAFGVGAGIGVAGLGMLVGAPVVVPLLLAAGAFVAVDQLFTPLSQLQHKAAVKLKGAVIDARNQGLEQLEGRREHMLQALRARLGEQLDAELERFDEVIERCLAEHRAAEAAEATRLAELEALRAALKAHREALGHAPGRSVNQGAR